MRSFNHQWIRLYISKWMTIYICIVCTYIHIHTYIYTQYIYIYISTVHIYIYTVHIYIYVYTVHVYIYIYIYIKPIQLGSPMTMEPAPSVPSEIIAEGFVCTTLLSLFRGLVRQRNHRKTLGISWKLSLIYSWFLISWLWIWWIFGMMGLYICICICIYNQDNYMYIWDYTCVYYTCVYIYGTYNYSYGTYIHIYI